MKRILIALLLGVSLVSCGAKREVNSITNNEFSDQSFFIDENNFNKKEVMELIKKDIEKVDNMYNGYASLIKGSINELFPLVIPTGNETQAFYDESIKGWMKSVEYRYTVRNRFLRG